MPYLLIFIFFQIITLSASAQEIGEIKGLVLDADKKEALPYTNIVVLHKEFGTISNEKGFFVLDIEHLNSTDTLSFQYVGYKTQNICISDMDSTTTIYLKEEIINLSEAFVFSNPPKAKAIVKKVIENKSENYKTISCKSQAFVRERNSSDIDYLKIQYKKNDIPELNEGVIKTIERKIPKHNISYTDFLGQVYSSNLFEDSIKIKATKVISLKSEDVSELNQIGKVFEKLFKNTKTKEYWKVKSGIVSQKLKINDDNESTEEDSIKDEMSYRTETYYLKQNIKRTMEFASMDDDDDWEFLYQTGSYEYTLVGGTRINAEDVYIIDFSPKNGGKFIGRLYISINTYALIRADYKYDTDKKGTDIHLFGVGYTSNYFEGSIFFEHKNENYVLKYLSKKTGNIVSINRPVSLIKKRERFLFDKELSEIKVKFNYKVRIINSAEILIINRQPILKSQFDKIKEQKYTKIVLVNQFDANLWKGYSIIEPTQQMKDYKKVD